MVLVNFDPLAALGLIIPSNLPARRDGPDFAMRVRKCISISHTRFARDAEFAERKYVFFSVERPEKKRSTV